MKTVYRIEHKELGFGPLCSEGYDLTLMPWTRFAKYHESVTEIDPNFVVCSNHRFGFTDLNTLFEVFKPKAFDTLEKFGFDLFEYCVDDGFFTEFPDGQVVFDKNHATKVS